MACLKWTSFKRHDIFSVALALYDKPKDQIETPTLCVHASHTIDSFIINS
jgi:hypothetical protein